MRAETQNDVLQALRGDLLRFARLQLRDAALAEDVVQESLLAAVAGADKFANRSSFKTWVFSILRNKIVDAIRGRVRETSLTEAFGEDEEIADVDADLFEPGGHWQPTAAPRTWSDPEQSFEQARFWEVFETCLERLPAKTGRVFMMREFLGFDTDEICKELRLSSSNCWVVLHRARLGLRACLEQNWFVGR
jgi:RNA polymerase sigma-70 factor (ECF subfamily)